jgi:hypothetical protein
MLHIVACIKQVPDTTQVRIDPETNTLVREGVPAIINPFDLHAIEAAVQIKERYGGTVSLLAMGPPQAVEALQKGLSFGADRAVLLTDRALVGSGTLAPTAAHAEKAARGYKDINLLGCKLLAPGGLLMTYSCSGGIGVELFQKIVAAAALDAGRTARIVKRLQGAADHPIDLAFPEGEYLKGLLLQID